MALVYISTGSNMGNRPRMLQLAEAMIHTWAGKVTAASSIVETKAWGNTDQPDFLNQALEIETTLTPEQLLKSLLDIEHSMGRDRKEKWGPRTIDLDILFYDDLILEQPGLTIPHPWMQERRFVLEPLAEICPDKVHPLLNKSVRMLLEELP